MNKYNKLSRHVLIAVHGLMLCLLFKPGFSYADSGITLAPSVMYFHYVEYDVYGVQADKESGFIPGIDFAIHTKNDIGLSFKAGLSYYIGNVNYDGHTQSAGSSTTPPFQTTTDETLQRLYIAFGKSFGEKYPFDIHLRIARADWQRDIQAKDNVAALSEYYQWNEVGAGLTQTLITRPAGQLSISADVYRVTSPTMTLNLSGDPTHKFALGAKPGYRVNLGWRSSKLHYFQYSGDLFYEYYEFGKSDVQPSTILPPGIYEPDSETYQAGVNIQLIFYFR